MNNPIINQFDIQHYLFKELNISKQFLYQDIFKIFNKLEL